jgi:hypothetical protein
MSRPQPRMKRRVGAGNDPRIRAEEAQRMCDSWNSLHPVGSPVILHRDNGDTQRTSTRSEAYVCESGYPVIFLDGVSGYYLLKRVERCSEGKSDG